MPRSALPSSLRRRRRLLTGRGRAPLLQAALLLAVPLLLAACSPRTNDAGPEPFTPTETAREVLDLVNQARSTAQVCGSEQKSAVPALRLEQRLTSAAQAHSEDMAEHRTMGHVGSNGSSFIQRAERSGYHWSALAENVAWGYSTASGVVAGWLDSPGHCVNIMNPSVTELGVGLEGTYWTQLFGAPRD